MAAALVPLIAVYLSPARADTALVYIGLLPTLVALTSGPRVAWATAFSTGLAIFVGLLFSTSPWIAAVYLAALGAGVAWSYTRGWQAPATYVATQAALAAVAAPGLSVMPAATPASLAAAASVAAFALVGGLWTALVGSLLLYDLPRAPHEPTTRSELVTFGIILGGSLGVGTWVAVTFAPGTNVWWVLLTMLVVLVPQHRKTVQRALWRAGGTVIGGVIGAALVILVGNPAVLGVIGLLAAIASAVTYLRYPYIVFSATLTLALIVLMLPLEGAIRGDLERVGFTLVAAALIVTVSALVHRLRD